MVFVFAGCGAFGFSYLRDRGGCCLNPDRGAERMVLLRYFDTVFCLPRSCELYIRSTDVHMCRKR